MSVTNNGIGRRDFVASSLVGTIGLTFPLTSIASSAQAAESTASPAGDASIRKFNINIPDSTLDDLRRRIGATRWPDRETVPDISQGVQLARLQSLCGYWAKSYDWRKIEKQLNALPQFITEIDGLDIHFIHVRSRNPDALPIIITHGWPGSILEMLKTIGPLTDPVAHGGRAEDAFHVVIPSIPGYGFSAKPRELGWGPGPRSARLGRAHEAAGICQIRLPRRRPWIGDLRRARPSETCWPSGYPRQHAADCACRIRQGHQCRRSAACRPS
ncbi:hypothetical protein ACVWWG_007838 [Bradyrhizobium sp. LB7.2]